ncbi:hypothetical protein [Streptomyces auratus]|uniref:Uncharacterized protein n=1 Tax=Streptomyces auratus AGR0001 TaxID=1160718 RepID=J2JUY2_9ACTN|nr:hypothetical protein [Streptomyces auratus]QTZ90235.1 hypothetical protein SU9_001190 [Streptomyces auratus AGR0001]
MHEQKQKQTAQRKGTERTKGRATWPPERKRIWRILGWALGLFVAVEAAFWGVTFTGDLALATGLSGTPGSYKVAHCYDADDSRRKSRYVCNGTFTADDDPADMSHQQLDDADDDYADGAAIAMRRSADAATYQATGLGPALSLVWKLGLTLSVLAFCLFQAFNSPKDQRRPVRSWRDSVAELLAMVSVAGVVLAVLDGAVALVAWAGGFLA